MIWSQGCSFGNPSFAISVDRDAGAMSMIGLNDEEPTYLAEDRFPESGLKGDRTGGDLSPIPRRLMP